MKTEKEVIEEMQKVCEQMVADDIEENPDCADEYFTCAACGEYKSLAGSIRYGEYRLCNDCVLLAEVSFELNKIKDIQDLIDKMEDKRLESQCEFIKKDQKAAEN